MHTSAYRSATFHHDGDVDGCMYLVDHHGMEIVTTLTTLLAALDAQREGELVAVTGPDAAVHDRFEVTAPAYREIVPGPWTSRTVQILRTDLEAFLIYARTTALESALSGLHVSKAPYSFVMEKLDRALAAIKELSPE